MKNRRKYIVKWAFSLISIVILISIISIGGIYIYVCKTVDFSIDEALFAQSKAGNITRLYYNSAMDGKYNPKYLDSIEPIGNRKSWFSIDDIGENLKLGFIAAEDRRFYYHNGVDKRRTAFAVFNYFLHIKPKFGGSSITQQVIKNISGDNESTPKRKIQEMVRATHIEQSHSKDEILEVYMNVIPMGERICGVGLAAYTYFAKSPSNLSIAEAATLVGIANAPSKYNPYTNPEGCVKKRNSVLGAMLEVQAISTQEYNTAIKEPLILVPRAEEVNKINSWFTETVCEDIVNDLIKSKGITENAARMLILNGGLSIYTTQDPEIQEILEDYFENSSNFPDTINSGFDYSMVITDSLTGDLLGIVGGAGKKDANRILNNALTLHPPGSALKPLALYAPLINQKKVNWATVFDDVPISFSKNSEGHYSLYPQNANRRYDGLTTLSGALTLSKNTVAVKLYNLLGKNSIFNSLYNDYGFNTIIRSKKLSNGEIISDIASSPLALGQLSYGISLRKLTEAYNVFPNEGILKNGRSYISVYDSQGNLLLENSAIEKEILTVESARIMNKMLSLVVEEGTAKGIRINDIIDTAGKTGTSGADRDRLFIGYTSYYTAGIRCGYNNNKTIGPQTVSHLKIWDDVMIQIHEVKLKNEENLRSFSTEGLEYLPYCKDSGRLYCDNCLYDLRGERLAYGYFTFDNKPEGLCDRHILCYYDSVSGDIKAHGEDYRDEELISLIKGEERKFPCEIEIGDQVYIYERRENDIKIQTYLFGQENTGTFGEERRAYSKSSKKNKSKSN